MATIKAVILNRIDKNGLTCVQIAVSHHGKTAYIPTKIKVNPKDFVGGLLIRGKNYQSVNAKILSLVNTYNERLLKLPNVDARNVVQLKDCLCVNQLNKYHKVSECFQAYMQTLKSPSSIESYTTSWKCFKLFCKSHDVNLESVDRQYVEKYQQWLHQFTPLRTQRRSKDYGMRYKISKQHPPREKYSQSTINTYMGHLKAVINYAIDEGWVKYDVHPFARITLRRDQARANILSAESMKKIVGYETDNPRYRRAIDMFMLQFYLGGPNLADIMKMDFRNDEITYERQKIASRTNGTVFVTIPVIPQARAIVNKYVDKETGLLNNPKNQSIHNMTSDFNYCMKCVAIQLGITEYITFTSARKCFAQIGLNLGFSDNYINYLLGHSMSKARGMLDPYSKVQTEMAAEILKVIAEYVEHPEEIMKVFRNNIQKLLLTIQK